MADLITRKPEVLKTCEVMLYELLDDSALDEKNKRLGQESDAIAK